MKIAIIVQDMCGQGVEYATAMTTRMFVKKGWSVDLLVSQIEKDYEAEGRIPFAVPPEVNWVYMPDRRARGNILYIRKYICKARPDLIVTEGRLYNKSVVLASVGLSKRNLPKFAMVTHGNTYPMPDNFLARLMVRLDNWLWFRGLSSLMVVNEKGALNMAERCRHIRHLKVANVNNACCDEMFFATSRLLPKHPWLIEKTCPTFVTAGSYTTGKCHLMVMEAFRLASQRRKIRLLVYGRGFLEQKYNEFIAQYHLEDVISVAGFTNQLPAEINAADCLISSSDEESFGITIVEALACHKPVISTDAPMGPREILADGKYGRLVPINDPVAMADAVVDCADGKIPTPPDESWHRYTIEKISQRYFDALGVK